MNAKMLHFVCFKILNLFTMIITSIHSMIYGLEQEYETCAGGKRTSLHIIKWNLQFSVV
jgi:hypothetical protein